MQTTLNYSLQASFFSPTSFNAAPGYFKFRLSNISSTSVGSDLATEPEVLNSVLQVDQFQELRT
jgi:hypothetical protein